MVITVMPDSQCSISQFSKAKKNKRKKLKLQQQKGNKLQTTERTKHNSHANNLKVF